MIKSILVYILTYIFGIVSMGIHSRYIARKRKKDDIASFKKELELNEYVLDKAIKVIGDYKEAIKSSLDTSKNYDATIKFCATIYYKFFQNGFILDLLDTDNLITLDNLYSELLRHNTYVAPTINLTVSTSLLEKNTKLNLPNELDEQKECDKLIKKLKDHKSFFHELKQSKFKI